MGYTLNRVVAVKDLNNVLGLSCNNQREDQFITNVAPSNKATKGSLTFSKSLLAEESGSLVIIPRGLEVPYNSQTQYIFSENPRLDFIRALDYLCENIGFSHFEFESQIHPSVKIGNNVVIENGCIIGENSIIEHNVVIQKGTTIGKNSRIRTNSSIGGDGFGFERSDENIIRFPHLGGVIIGDNVEIGANNTVSCGTLSDTIIEDNVKTDNIVHIAHNCHIEQGVIITACAEISGGVKIGRNSWIGPNSSIIQKVSVGKGSLVGIGAVVTKNISENSIFVGNPAKFLRNNAGEL